MASPTTTPRRRFASTTSLAIYATIVATAVVAGTNDIEPGWTAWQLLITLVAALVVLYFAEVYSDVLGDPSPDPLRRRVHRAAISRWPVTEPLVPMGLPLLLGGLGVISDELAVLASLLVAVASLGIGGTVAARLRGRAWPRAVASGVVGALVGMAIVSLKAWH